MSDGLHVVQEAPFQAYASLDSKAIVEESDGDLIIEGWAATTGLDDQDEFFSAKALREGAEEFMAQPLRPLLYHHKFDHLLGEILSLDHKAADGIEGLWMRARVDEPASGSWAEDVYRKIKKGSMKGLSVAGRFFREYDPGQKSWRIFKSKFREVSVTPFPINTQSISAVAQKAFENSDDPEEVAAAEKALEIATNFVQTLEEARDSLAVSQPPVE